MPGASHVWCMMMRGLVPRTFAQAQRTQSLGWDDNVLAARVYFLFNAFVFFQHFRAQSCSCSPVSSLLHLVLYFLSKQVNSLLVFYSRQPIFIIFIMANNPFTANEIEFFAEDEHLNICPSLPNGKNALYKR